MGSLPRRCQNGGPCQGASRDGAEGGGDGRRKQIEEEVGDIHKGHPLPTTPPLTDRLLQRETQSAAWKSISSGARR